MGTADGKMWDGEMEVPFQAKGNEGIEYKYAMYRDGKLVWTEWEVAPHKVAFDGVTNNYVLSDQWRPIPEDLPLFFTILGIILLILIIIYRVKTSEKRRRRKERRSRRNRRKRRHRIEKENQEKGYRDGDFREH